MGIAENLPWTKQEFEQQLRSKGKAYHIYHPFNVMMAAGKCTPEQLRGWVANRFYYQISIPLKDAAIMSNLPDREMRREWIQRITDHDGAPAKTGRHRGLAAPGPSRGLEREESPRSSTCCLACVSPWMPTSTSPARRRGRKPPAAR